MHNEWKEMPEYDNVKQPDPEITATFKFRNTEDYEQFKALVKEHIYNGEKVFDGMQRKDKKQAWYPLKKKASRYRYISKEKLNPRYPIYIVSKNRWDRNPTSRALKEMNVPFYMVVEKDQVDQYLKLVPREQILVIPQKYFDEYDKYWDDDDPRTGPGCARNFAWDHALENGFDWHWVMDDNIESFERLNKNMKVKCMDGNIFYSAEDFVLRYKNVAQAGFQYSFFCPAIDARPPFKLNTRIYSCLLIRNDVPFRWRGRYNEDTDLSLRMMKAGWCTIQFNAFLQGKRATQTVKGGNSAEFYDEEGTYKKSKMLEDMHPDVAKVAWKFNRWHHHVNYKPYETNKLILKDNLSFTDKTNNYSMELVNTN